MQMSQYELCSESKTRRSGELTCERRLLPPRDRTNLHSINKGRGRRHQQKNVAYIPPNKTLNANTQKHAQFCPETEHSVSVLSWEIVIVYSKRWNFFTPHYNTKKFIFT